MGVHLTFVRSVDLDEWTQRQVDAMRLGGNGNAREFFRKHGFTELHGSKTEKKYKSKAAVAYRAELKKLVDAEAVKRGEMVADEEMKVNEGSLLENLAISEKKDEQELARRKLAEARSGSAAGVLKPSSKLASAMPGASKLAVPAGGMLRKPTSSSLGNNLLKKKPMPSSSRLRVNKLSIKPANGTSTKDDDFEDIEATQKAAAAAQEEAKRLADEKVNAKKLQVDLNAGLVTPKITAEAPAENTTVPSPKPIEPVKVEPPKKATMEDNVSKLKDMNKDFFSQF